eukprot:231750-Chlamydomonas_euryale.AAC.1
MGGISAVGRNEHSSGSRNSGFVHTYKLPCVSWQQQPLRGSDAMIAWEMCGNDWMIWHQRRTA